MRDINNPLLTQAIKNYTISQSGCYEYNGFRNKDGYAFYTIHVPETLGCLLSRVVLAKKLNKTYEDLNKALHKCDNPACINEDHLFEGSQSDNMKDSSAKNRHYKQQFLECPQGHEYNEENTYWYNNTRRCKICQRDRDHGRKR